MLNVNIGIDLAAEGVNLYLVCPQRSISKLIPSLQSADVEPSAGRCGRKTVAANLTIDRDASKQRLTVQVLIMNSACQRKISGGSDCRRHCREVLGVNPNIVIASDSGTAVVGHIRAKRNRGRSNLHDGRLE